MSDWMSGPHRAQRAVPLDAPVGPGLDEVWFIGNDGVLVEAVYASENTAKAAVMGKFANHWTAKGVTETRWTTYGHDQARRRQHLCGSRAVPESFGNTGWFVQPVPIVWGVSGG